MKCKFKSGDKVFVTGYKSPTAFFRDFQNKIVTVETSQWDEFEKIERLTIVEFNTVEPYHSANAAWFKKLDKIVRIYDNGGETLDRYTAVYMDCPEARDNTFSARGMCESPFSPQGFGQYCMATPGRHLGKRIKFEQLPIDCQKLISQDLK